MPPHALLSDTPLVLKVRSLYKWFTAIKSITLATLTAAITTADESFVLHCPEDHAHAQLSHRWVWSQVGCRTFFKAVSAICWYNSGTCWDSKVEYLSLLLTIPETHPLQKKTRKGEHYLNTCCCEKMNLTATNALSASITSCSCYYNTVVFLWILSA